MTRAGVKARRVPPFARTVDCHTLAIGSEVKLTPWNVALTSLSMSADKPL